MSMDWSKIVSELFGSGLTQAEIVGELRRYGVQVTRQSLYALKTGRAREPGYSTGAALLRLWRERIGEDAAA